MSDAYSESLDQVAQHLFEQSVRNEHAREAMLRSAIGRAYYSAFWLARDFVESAGTVVGRQQPHKTVCDHFCGSQNPDLCSIGLDLRRLKAARADADYAKGYSPSREETVMQIVRARSIRADLKKRAHERA